MNEDLNEIVKQIVALTAQKAELVKQYNEAGQRGNVANARKQMLLHRFGDLSGVSAERVEAMEKTLVLFATEESVAFAQRTELGESISDLKAELERLHAKPMEGLAERTMKAAESAVAHMGQQRQDPSPPVTSELRESLASAVLNELRGRAGIGPELESIDAEIMAEIRTALADRILDVLRKET